MTSTALHDLGVAQLATGLRERRVSAVEAAQHFLARAQAHQNLGAYVAVNPDITLAQARAQDAAIAAGTAGPLAGVPIAHKDIFVTKDFPSTAGSKMLAGYQSPFDATVVTKLADAGAVTLGKLNCDEFAMGVAARLAPAVTGPDPGGSIRQPASFCGITGIKPTYGRASRYGMIAFASSLDQAGPMARSAEDCALLLSAMCGPDPDRDSTSLDVPAENFSAKLNDSIDGLRIGIPAEFFGEGLAPDVRAAVDGALKEYEKLGAKLVPISLPRTQLSIPVYYIIAPAEASSNISRFDGVKFGHRAKDYTDLVDMYKKTRAMIADDFQNAFKSCDVIAGPVAPTVAWKLGDHGNDPLADYLADIFTLPGSLAGLPGMSVPAGFGEGGMPVGLQLLGNYFQEARLLNAAHRLQQATDFHLRRPEGF